MKLKIANLDPNALTSVRGSAYIRDTKHGPVIQSKPRVNLGLRTPAARAWQKRFGFAATMASSPEALNLMTAMEMAKGTQQVPRDILTMAALGRYYEITHPDGEPWGNLEGPILFQKAEIPMSTWQWTTYDTPWSTSYSTSSWCWKGHFFTIPYNQTVYRVRAIIDAIAGAQYQAAIGQCTTARVITAITKSAKKIPPAAGQQMFEWDLEVPLIAGTWNFLIIGRVDLLATTPIRIYWPSGQTWLMPWIMQNDARSNTLLNPVVGNTLQTSNAPGLVCSGVLVNL